MTKPALLLIDIQNDYFAAGRNPLFRAEQAALRAAEVLRHFREKERPVLHVQHISLQPGATFFLPDSDGCQIHPLVAPLHGEPIIIKHTPDSFFETDLRQQLSAQGIGRLTICGMMSHMCIDTTVRSAKRLGYPVTLAEDACATKDLAWNGEPIAAATVHQAFMAALQGIFAEVLFSQEAIRRIP